MKVAMSGSASDPSGMAAAHPKQAAPGGSGDRIHEILRTRSGIVIVRDMWLTGFDAPSLHTMYVDKPMRGHGLMQAIARVNRVFKDKPGGLVVDYLGLAEELKQCARRLHDAKWRNGTDRAGSGRSRSRDAGEIRRSAPPCSTASTGHAG